MVDLDHPIFGNLRYTVCVMALIRVTSSYLQGDFSYYRSNKNKISPEIKHNYVNFDVVPTPPPGKSWNFS